MNGKKILPAFFKKFVTVGDGDVKELISQVKGLAENQEDCVNAIKNLKQAVSGAKDEIEATKKMREETAGIIDDLQKKAGDLAEKCLEIERQIAETVQHSEKKSKSLGQICAEAEGVAAFAKTAQPVHVAVKSIVNATGQNQPLVPADRQSGIIAAPNRVLRMRDLLPSVQTNSNLIEYTRELVFTNSAGPQYSSGQTENVLKNESDITFEMANTAVVTLAHFINASKQIMNDAPQLAGYIDARLIYGLKLVEDDQLLNGDGTSGNLSGILDTGNYTAYNRAQSGDTILDTIRRAKTQVELSEYFPSAIVLNPEDWEEAELLKDGEQRYVIANPFGAIAPVLWQMPVIVTKTIPQGTFLLGAFDVACSIYDREQANVQISIHHDKNFTKNMVTILAEERLGFAVYRPAAFVSGTF